MVRDINTMNNKIVTMIALEIPANLFRRLTMKSFMLFTLIFMGVNACATKSTNSNGYAPNNSSKPPNFIVILTDDLGWSSLSVSMDKNYPNAKSDYHKTPNIDAIIEGGLRFSSGYAAAPVCSPTRYSIQFGKSPARLKRTRVLGKSHIDHNQVGIPQVLKSIDKSYRAAHIGKWHIDKDPSAYGYDVHDGITKNKAGDFDNNKTQWYGYADEDPKRVNSMTKRAVEFMRESVEREQPFFLQLSHYAVHSNIVYSDTSYAEVGKRQKGQLHKNQGYAAMLEDMDLSIGSLLEAYAELDLAKDTYIIFLSDNGGMPVLPMQVNRGKPYRAGLNSPLLRGKWDLTEGGIRVPFSIAGPTIRSGGQSDTPVMSYDILPTIADLAGSQKGLPKNLDGVSFTPLFEDHKADLDRPFDGLVFHFPHYNRVGMNEPHSAIRYENFKLIHFPASGRNLLFDLVKDPGERVDLSEKMPKMVESLNIKLDTYLTSVDAEIPEDAESWKRIGKNGKVRTKFFNRYDRILQNQ
jgi:arylsulfatase A-like enzyme